MYSRTDRLALIAVAVLAVLAVLADIFVWRV
jgi:hypothetical protein